MHLVQVNPVGAQPAEGGFDRPLDVPPRSAHAPVGSIGARSVHPAFGGHDYVVTHPVQGTAQEFFALPRIGAINTSAVEKRSSGVADREHDVIYVVGAQRDSERVAAEANP